MNKEIPTIEIRGYCGAGKSSLAYLIKLALQEHGIHTDIKEYSGDFLETYDEKYIIDNWPKSLEHFKGKTIQIKTHQLKRDSLEGKPSIPFDEIEFTETPTNIVKEAIEEYNKTQSEIPRQEYPDDFIGFKP